MKINKKAMCIVMSIIVVFILAIVGISISGKKSKKASSGNVETTTKSKEKTSKSTEQTTTNSSTQETTLTQETTTTGQPAVATKTLYVIANGANVRDNYENGSKVGHLNQNDTVVVVGEPIADSSGMLWYQLDNGNYICADLLGTEPVGNNGSSSVNNSASNGSGSNGNNSRSGKTNTGANNDYGDNADDNSNNGDSGNDDNGGNNGGNSAGNNGGTGGLNVSYVGFRTDCEQSFRTPFLSMRATEIPKYSWSADMRNRLINATWNESLYHVAQARAKEIVADFSHNSAHNYTSGYNINEALAINNVVSNDASVSANNVLNGWFNSPGHYNVITHGDQYAVACYQYYNSFFWVFVSGDYNMYCADAYAAYNSFDWQECGFNDEQSYKNWLYTQFTNDRGNRVIW